jgi:hypothetical protein
MFITVPTVPNGAVLDDHRVQRLVATYLILGTSNGVIYRRVEVDDHCMHLLEPQ